MEKIAVIGAGTMGSGIAQVAIESGIAVSLCDIEEAFVAKGRGTIEGFIKRKAEKGKITGDEARTILGRLHTTVRLEEALAGAGLVIEAIIENLEAKKKIFAEMDRKTPAATVLASNTSTLSITAIGAATGSPERVVGMHFFSPVPLMNLVEVIRGEKTSEATLRTALEAGKKLGKTPIVVKDVPGFIVNRFMLLLYNEGANLVYNGTASAEDIDLAMRLGANHPMGPLQVADLAGVDVCYYALKAVYEATGDVRYKPSPLWEQMIQQKKLGRKTKQGFYKYS
ncbi:MAG: 3-hydroxyacyl-CoA dehydrogenase family protein [bacterium]